MKMDEELTKLTGKPVYLLFHNEKNFYTVMKFKLTDDTGKTITATGILPDVQMDTVYNIYGNYVEHPRYGLQFQISMMERPLPDEEEGIIRYLCSSQFPGIGRKTAEKIVQVLGENCLAMIRENPEILKQIKGLNTEKMEIIQKGVSGEDDGMEQLIQFLNVHGLGMRNLSKLTAAYGKDALHKLKENPYRVIEECDGFGFKTADKIAKAMGIEDDDHRRLYACMVSITMDLCVRNGDSYVLPAALEAAMEKEMQGISYDFDELLEEAQRHGSLIIENGKIYPKTQWESEEFIASYLCEFPYVEMEPCSQESVDHYLEDMQNKAGISYDDKQVEAIHSLFRDPFLILTGGPGTGKTTVVRAMVKLFTLIYPNSKVVCAAPTGRAAKRLNEMTGVPSFTIHSLLKWDLDANRFGKNEDDPLDADLVIIDEFSMVDDWLFYNLLKACRYVKRICVIGDEDQLPSVSPGCVLRDLIASGAFPVVRLEHIYRQQQGSDVITLAHQIHDGKVDFSVLKNNVAFLECSRYDIKSSILKIVQNAVEKGYDLNDIQVLSPVYSGIAGIDILNNALQECFNPASGDKKEAKSGYTVFREGDKILQLKNQPDDEVFNGDIGILEEVTPASETPNHQTVLLVDYDGTYVEYTPENFQNITLAYCISVHKSQGSEYPIVIMPVTFLYYRMLQRKLLYTAVTRARKSLVLLGEKAAFEKGISTLETHIRATTLAEKIQEHKKPE